MSTYSEDGKFRTVDDVLEYLHETLSNCETGKVLQLRRGFIESATRTEGKIELLKRLTQTIREWKL